MRFKIILIIVSLGLLFSCGSKQKSQDQLESERLSKQAFMMSYVQCDLVREKCTDSALLLYNKAIELDNENFSAYDNKISILSEKKDLVELIKTTESLIKIRPQKPFYKLQKGIFLLAKGNNSEAEALFKKALIEYEDLLDGDLSDFDLNLEYISSLVLNDKFNLAKAHLEFMKNENYLESQIQFLDFYKIEVNPKAKMIEYFNSDKAVEDIFE